MLNFATTSHQNKEVKTLNILET